MSRFRYLIAVAILGWLVAPAAASDVIANFTLDGVTFSDMGTASGGFTLDLTTGALSNVNITTSTTTTWTGASYSDSASTNTFSNSSSPQFSFSQFTGFEVVFEGSILDINLGVMLTDFEPCRFSKLFDCERLRSVFLLFVRWPGGLLWSTRHYGGLARR